jgi:integrase/recombinase XerD
MNAKPKNYVLAESRILTESELKQMLKAIKPNMESAARTKRHLHFINDYYLILIGSLTGLRVSEVAGLKIGDVSQNSIRVLGKGSKVRTIPLGRRGRTAVDELIKLKVEVLNQKVDSEQRLFLNRNGRPFSRFSIERRFTFWKKRCRIDRDINFHSLRHYFSCHLLNNGFLIHELQKFLGHSSVATTSQYLHFTRETQDRVDQVL